jgi:hypothetical protein
MSRLLITLGLVLLLLGVLWPILKKIGIGHLPGDMLIQQSDFTFYFPITTCIIISVLLSTIFWILHR